MFHLQALISWIIETCNHVTLLCLSFSTSKFGTTIPIQHSHTYHSKYTILVILTLKLKSHHNIPLKMKSNTLHTPLQKSNQKPSYVIFVTFGSILFLMSMLALIIINQTQNPLENLERQELARGVAQGVSPKSNSYDFHKVSYNWTDAMFSWQRTAFHFQPQKNWMNGKSTLPYFFLFTFFNFSLLYVTFQYIP